DALQTHKPRSADEALRAFHSATRETGCINFHAVRGSAVNDLVQSVASAYFRARQRATKHSGHRHPGTTAGPADLLERIGFGNGFLHCECEEPGGWPTRGRQVSRRRVR